MATRTPTRPRAAEHPRGAAKPAAAQAGRAQARRPASRPGPTPAPASARRGRSRCCAASGSASPTWSAGWPAGSAAAPATSTPRTAGTASGSRCSAWPPSWRRSSGGTCRGRSARSSTRGRGHLRPGRPGRARWCCSASGCGILRHPQDAEAGGRIGIGLGRSCWPSSAWSTSPAACPTPAEGHGGPLREAGGYLGYLVGLAARVRGLDLRRGAAAGAAAGLRPARGHRDAAARAARAGQGTCSPG